MLFNSYLFLFVFLPVSLFGFYYLIRSNNKNLSILWLVTASLFFYSWWNPAYFLLIISSILFNYFIGRALLKYHYFFLLCIGVVGNLALLGYFKYGNFVVDNINIFFEEDLVLKEIILPIAISFFTFQQIAYLVDTFRGESKGTNFINYCLFVTFFPQLIAGPIVHHKEMLPQFTSNNFYKLYSNNLVTGSVIFLIGLFKKCILADGIAGFSTPVFTSAEQGNVITFFEAWGGALAYTFQLYFDFSGYSEMALGLGRMFGIILPVNFFSPYKANNIIDFWRRWHMTLSRFLRTYLYISLGGNRKGYLRRYVNLLITMILGGLWHGAAWNFMIWGTLHGLYLIINHAWRFITNTLNLEFRFKFLSLITSRALTFFAVVFAWVIFRAESLSGAGEIYQGMLGLNGFSFPSELVHQVVYLQGVLPNINISAEGLGSFGSPMGYIWIVFLLALVWILPNTIEAINDEAYLEFEDKKEKLPIQGSFRWKLTTTWSFGIAIMAALSILSLNEVSEFLYFQF
jgi:D-alanyl-lipoteichoic acid acyltransferase DltB (MBOAT superfamily)